MSAGNFVINFYEGDSGDVHLLRQQPESELLVVAGATNDEPAGPATSVFWAKRTRGATEYGLKPRGVIVRWTGTPPTGYKPGERLEICAFSPGFFNGVTIGATGTYLGADVQVVGKKAENIYPEV